MRWTLISFLCFAIVSNSLGQNFEESIIVSESPINIGLEEVNNVFIPPSAQGRNLKSGTSKECNMNITFVNFPEEAKEAFKYAVSIWEQHVSSPVDINILARWENIEGNIVANSRPTAFHKNFNEAPKSNIFYPIALSEKLSGRELNGSKEADIECSFNGLKSWYLGIDGNTNNTKYDLVTVALHEIAHGLGIAGFFKDENGLGKYNNTTDTPSAYDYFVFNTLKQRIADNNLFNSPSVELHQQLTSNSLNFIYSEEMNETATANIYAPGNWNPGASIYHLKQANVSAGEENELMSPFTYKGEAIHAPGEKTLHILSEIGWNTVSLQLAQINDIEETCETLPIQTNIISNSEIDNSALILVFSKDFFKTKDSTLLTYNNSKNNFEGSLPIEFHKGNIQYYFSAKTKNNKTQTYPGNAPSNMLTFKIGDDYYQPTLKHNPTKMVSKVNPVIDFTAVATDNMGIQSVKVEYKINGNKQETFTLNAQKNDIYNGTLSIPFKLNKNDKVEYRILAEDNSIRKNKKYLPEKGFYEVVVFETLEPKSGYSSDFNTINSDFTINDFDISAPSGFSNAILHTINPYPESAVQNEKYNLFAQLNYPIILEENGTMTFDEIVLVEPGEHGTNFTDDIFWDYVIVEASKNNGITWLPLVDGYDSGINETWATQFSSSLKSNMSSASAHENMFWQQSINLTESENFSAGDTVIFRFRLASDNSVNGWGWAIDNLQIQNEKTEIIDEITAMDDVNIYPNPFSNNVFIDCNNMTDQSSVEIRITDLTGKTVFNEINYNIEFSPKLKLDLSSIQSGIYLASITDANYNTITKRIIKN